MSKPHPRSTTYFNPPASTYTYTGAPPNPSVLAFHKRLPDYNETPLISLPTLTKELGVGHVLLKDESKRFGLPAFKILGASWAIYRAVCHSCSLPLTTSLHELGAAASVRNIKLVTCTEGNWGRATARMALYLRIPCTVFVPRDMDTATQEKTRGEGAEVVVVDGHYDDSIRAAREESERGGALLVMDVSWQGYETIPQWVVEGYGTMLRETDQQLREILGDEGRATHAIASVGVGSWAQAVAMHYKSSSSNSTSSNASLLKVIAVEPTSAACLQASLRLACIQSITTSSTIMNGMNCGTVSYTAWPVLRDGVDVSITVSDRDVHEDVEYLKGEGVHVGPCGAATLSALRELCGRREEKERVGLDERSVVVLFSTEGAREYVVPR